MLSLDALREFLGALLVSDFPEFIDRDLYRQELPTMWMLNPARAFLRLSDDDQAKVLQEIKGTK